MPLNPRAERIPFTEGIATWTFSNGYRNGVLRSHHWIQWTSEARALRAPEPAAVNPKLLSSLPGKSAVTYVDRTLNPSRIWELLSADIPILHQQREMGLTPHLGEEITIALIDAAPVSAIRVPSIIAVIPITNRSGLEADLTRMQAQRIVVNGKLLQFSEAQTYRGVTFQPVQLPLGFFFSIKGAYALINDYWIFCTTVPGLKFVIDSSTDQSTNLAQIEFPEPVSQPRDSHLLVQPDLLISELRGLMPILGLIAPLAGSSLDLRLMRQIVANSSPLETLGPVSVGVNFDDGGMNVDVQVTVPLDDRS